MSKKYRTLISELLMMLSETLKRPDILVTIICDTSVIGDLIEESELLIVGYGVKLNNLVWKVAVRQKCLGIIPDTFIICGEEGFFCSDGCLDVGPTLN